MEKMLPSQASPPARPTSCKFDIVSTTASTFPRVQTPTAMTSLPATQSPTVTLLQKSREGQLPKGAQYMTEFPPELFPAHDVRGSIEKLYVMPGEDDLRRVPEHSDVPKYNGIGPLDGDGLPLGLRMGVEQKNQKAWYKKMYQQLHSQDQEEDIKMVKTSSDSAPLTVLPELMPDEVVSKQEKKSSKSSPSKSNAAARWIPADASYRPDVYRNQPRSIVDYEPGLSSIALKTENMNFLYNPPLEKPGQYSKYEEDVEASISVSRKGTLLATNARENYKQIQGGAEIPVSGLQLPYPKKKDRNFLQPARAESNSVSDYPSHGSSPSQSLDRRKRDEDEAKRRVALSRITWEHRERRAKEQRLDNERRKHNDYWSEREKSPIPPASLRFNEDFPLNASPVQPVLARAYALYDFRAQDVRELDLHKGDGIILLKQIDGNWMLGEHNGRQGIFPLSYVQVETSLDEAERMSRQKEGFAMVKFNFRPVTKLELPLSQGEHVKLLAKMDDNWYEGLGESGMKGILPASYITVLKEPSGCMSRQGSFGSLPSSWDAGRMSSGASSRNFRSSESNLSAGASSADASYQPLPIENSICQVIFTYTPLNDDELELKEGDLVSVIERCDDGWFVGILQRTQKFGTFPGNYVQAL